MKSKAAMGWYYIGVKDALQEDFAGIPAYEEYKMLVKKFSAVHQTGKGETK